MAERMLGMKEKGHLWNDSLDLHFRGGRSFEKNLNFI